MHDLDTRVEFHPPAALSGHPAERDFLVVEEEILVHAAGRRDHAGVHQHAGSGDPVDGAGTQVPCGLVFPPRAGYELLADRSCQAGEGSRRALGGSVGVLQAEADDTRHSLTPRLEVVESGEDPTDESRRDLDVRIEDQEPARARDAPAGIDSRGESAIIRTDDEPKARSGIGESSRDRPLRGVVDHDNLAVARGGLGLREERAGQANGLAPRLVVDDHDRQPASRQACPFGS